MSSREQASAFRKHRDADDKQGNFAWASKVGGRALRATPTAAAGEIEDLFELNEIERIVWRLLKLARKYTDLEHAGLIDTDTLRSVLRGFVAADVIDVVDASEARALLPAEVKRLRAEVAGKAWRPTVGTLTARVYRPEIGLDGASSSSSSSAPEYFDGPPPPSSSSSSSASGSTSSSSTSSTSTVPSTPLTADEEVLKASLLAAAASMAQQSHYAFLNVRQGADDAAVRNAYVSLARDYHPDRIQGSSLGNDKAVVAAVDALFRRLNDANKAIGSADSRSRYDRELALQESSSSVPAAADGKRPRRAIEARNAYAMAETYFKRRDFKQAEIHYRQAVAFDAEEPMLQVALAWCLFLNPELPEETRIGEARKRLEDLVKKTRNGDASYKLGRVLREAGDDAAANRLFEQAVRLSPGHIDAQREVRLIESRRDAEKAKADKSAGLLGKLFKK